MQLEPATTSMTRMPSRTPVLEKAYGTGSRELQAPQNMSRRVDTLQKRQHNKQCSGKEGQIEAVTGCCGLAQQDQLLGGLH